MKNITATCPAWLTHGGFTVADLENMSPEKATDALMFMQCNYGAPDGWVRVGTAEITVTLDRHEDVVVAQVAVLKEAKARLQAETQAKLTAIDEQIGRLLCLEHKTDDEAG